MPPLLGARTCWRAGWVALGLGVVLMAASNPIASVIFRGQSPAALGGLLYSVLTTVTFVTLPGGAMLLVGSVVLRHVERLTDALVASGTIAAPAPAHGVERRPGRTPDGDVDVDDLRHGLDDVVEHEPGAR